MTELGYFRVDAPIPLAEIPSMSAEALEDAVVEAIAGGSRVASLFARPSADESLQVLAVLADPDTGMVATGSAEASQRWRSWMPKVPQVHLFEREMAEEYELELEGHPWPKPVRFLAGKGARVGVTDFHRVEGDDIHEVAVGPVHAGVIEPGHFRFQCHGETVFLLDIALGYQHRGLEKALLGQPGWRSVCLAETIAGDSSIAHATAHAQLVESLCGIEVPLQAQALRAMALELERLANHTGDLGALAGDVGYLPTASFCGRLRGDLLNLSAALCGSRFGRGLLRLGGVGHDVDAALAADISARLGRLEKELRDAIGLLWETPSVRARFDETSVLTPQDASSLGLVGPAARSTGLAVDARLDFPCGHYSRHPIDISTCAAGSVYARAWVRWQELERSIAYVQQLLQSLPGGPIVAAVGAERAVESLAVGVAEGWRGEVWHLAVTDEEGALSRYDVVDPSFHNWSGLAVAMRGQAISDFPLTNKSFNLSYCGFDL
ncbi:MAG: hydrogenase [Myxococcota bacterium]|jgi:Ni,Fe-hydrogenase III large subunit|nr:hydrogenase [Myxococcota bacterium]